MRTRHRLNRPGSADVALLVARPARRRDRLWARLAAHGLDRKLAAGVPPEATAALALRARRLVAITHRRQLAGSYQRIVQDARAGTTSRTRIAPCRARITAGADALLRLAEALVEPGPVAAQGVAQARVLLTDGSGPLYSRSCGANLSELASRAATDLARVGW